MVPRHASTLCGLYVVAAFVLAGPWPLQATVEQAKLIAFRRCGAKQFWWGRRHR